MRLRRAPVAPKRLARRPRKPALSPASVAQRCAITLFTACLLSCAAGDEGDQAPSPGAVAPEELAAQPAEDDRQPSNLPIDPNQHYSADAKFDTYRMLLEDMHAKRHPSDGGGIARLDSYERADGGGKPLRAGDYGRFHFTYEAGPLGIEVEGEIHFQVSSFWNWDPPQNKSPEGRGYTTVRTDAEGVKLLPVWFGSEILAIGIAGRKLEAGERIYLTYGASPIGARVDEFSERGSQFWFSSDGDADGLRNFLANPPTVDILPNVPDQLVLVAPTTLAPGEPFEALLSIVDQRGNAGFPYTGRVKLDAPAGIDLPRFVDFKADDRGHKRVAGVAQSTGIYRIAAVAQGNAPQYALRVESNPIVVKEGIARVRWADLHGHSQLSDGTGTPEDFFAYARNTAGLDIASLTDHDHWGIEALDTNAWMWETIRKTVKAHNEPGLFVTLLGYEWTSWLHGHRHVLYFNDGDEEKIYSSMDPAYQNPAQLWEALNGQEAMTFAHHSAGGPVSTNWWYPPDPILEPITEIVSVHGSSEAPDAPSTIYNPVRGNFIQDVLRAGYRFGFVGSGDSHDGHPGLAHLANQGGGGLAAIFTEALTRKAVLEALRARHTYATNGARIWLEVSIDDKPMGSTLPPASALGRATQPLRVRAAGEGKIARIDIVRSGSVSTIDVAGQLEVSIDREIPRLRPGEFHYVRVIEESGAMAWSSPIYAD